MSWPFPDPPDVMVFTSRDVVERGNWIHYVGHDLDDGAWQFLSINGAPESELDARLVLLRNIVELDPTLKEVADLPLGWIAWRNSKEAKWKRRQR
jgi:hypothetical protein